MARRIPFERLGRGPAIDLAGTVVVLGSGEQVDLLDSPADLAGWLRLERQWVGEAGEDAALRLADFRRLRASIRELFLATVAGSRLPGPAVEAVNAASAAVPRWPVLDVRDAARPRTVEDGASGSRTAGILATIARSAIEILGGPDRERLRVCGAPRCGRFFIATRPRQVWCTPACGNRARVARHHARSRA